MLLNFLVHFHAFGESSCALEHFSSSPCFCSVILCSWTFQFIFMFIWCHLVLCRSQVFWNSPCSSVIYVSTIPNVYVYLVVLFSYILLYYLCLNGPECSCVLSSLNNPKFSCPSLCLDGPKCLSTTLYLGCPKFMLVKVLLLVLMTCVLLLVLVVTICPSFKNH